MLRASAGSGPWKLLGCEALPPGAGEAWGGQQEAPRRVQGQSSAVEAE